MIRIRRIVFRLSTGITLVIAALTMTAPAQIQAAAAPIVVDTAGTTATDCGSYDGKESTTALVTAVNGATDGQTVVICPGTYNLSGQGQMYITGKSKVTIKAAVDGVDRRPILEVDTTASAGMLVEDSINITLDGLVIEAIGGGISFTGISIDTTSITIKNCAVIGADNIATLGIRAMSDVVPKALKLTISNSYIGGYTYAGIHVTGNYKFNISSVYLDASDGGRVDASSSAGMVVISESDKPVTGTITKSQILNSYYGFDIRNSSKINITNNLLVNQDIGVLVEAFAGQPNADNIKISGNSILEVRVGGTAVWLSSLDAANVSMKKATVSGNLITAVQYTPAGSLPRAVVVDASTLAPTLTTATVSSNTFYGFPATNKVVNISGNAGVKESKNQSIP